MTTKRKAPTPWPIDHAPTAADLLAMIREALGNLERDIDRGTISGRGIHEAELETYDDIRAIARPRCPDCGDQLVAAMGSDDYLWFDSKPGTDPAYCDTCDREIEVWT